MKKIFAVLILTAIFACTVFAENQDLSRPKDESKWSDMTYITAPVMKILESKDCYVVIYQKKYAGTATVTIPKTWNSYQKNTARKLKFRSIKDPKQAFITVIKKGGEFHHVILSCPMQKNNSLWGIISNDLNVEGADKETLEELDV